MPKANLIDPVQDRFEKRMAFDSHLKRYKKAIQAGCYLEALMIDYACLEDRLRYLLFYLGMLQSPASGSIGSRRTAASYKRILDRYMQKGDRTIRHIAGKRNLIRCIFLLVAENKPDQDDVVQTVLCASLSDAVRVREVLDLMTEIEAWCDYRNAVVHDLMDKSVVSLDAHIAEQAELGYKLFRRLDNMVGWVDRKHISRKIGIEISRSRQKSKQGRR